MSDYIKREDVLQAIAGLLNVIEQIDSADVVEAVRCEDCKWWTILPPDKQFIEGRIYGTCYKWSAMARNDIGTQSHYYCVYGERERPTNRRSGMSKTMWRILLELDKTVRLLSELQEEIRIENERRWGE